MVLFQVHGLDAETWKKVDVVYIDIADRSQVELKVMFHDPYLSMLSISPHPCCSFWVLSPGLQARGGSLQVQVSEDRTRPSRTRLEGTELVVANVSVGIDTFEATEIH